MLLLVGSGLVFFPSDEPEGEGLHTVIAHCTVQAGNAAVDGGARARRRPRARRHPRAASQGAGRLRPKAGTAPQGLPAAPGPF